MPKVNRGALPGEAVLLSGAAVVIAAGLFEWVVIAPDHPVQVLLRVLGAALAASILIVPFRKTAA